MRNACALERAFKVFPDLDTTRVLLPFVRHQAGQFPPAFDSEPIGRATIAAFSNLSDNEITTMDAVDWWKVIKVSIQAAIATGLVKEMADFFAGLVSGFNQTADHPEWWKAA